MTWAEPASTQGRRSLIAVAVAFVIVVVVSHLRASPYNNYVLLAQALSHGHVWIDWPGAYIDAVAYGARHYIIEAPLPALALIPFVVLFETSVNQTLLAAAFAAVAIGATWTLGERFNLTPATNAWMCAFALAGTDLLWCASLGDVWFVAHAGAFCFTMLALAECAGARRPWLAALWGACAAGCRFSMLPALAVYFVLCLRVARGPVRWREEVRQATAGFALALVPAAALWVAYNFARWGTWSDIGYTLWYHQDQAGLPTGSPFRIAYLPYEMQSFFVQAPTWLGSFPFFRPEYSGVALTWTSPALLLSVLARTPGRWVLAMWAGTLLTAIPNFLYYVNGFAQFGMRHALDFEPFLIALMMLGVRDRFPRWGYPLVAYSILIGLWGCWYWSVYVRT